MSECSCMCCDEHNAAAKHNSKVERIMLLVMALFFMCFFSWVSFTAGKNTGLGEIQKEAVQRGHGVYLPTETPSAFKWKD